MSRQTTVAMSLLTVVLLEAPALADGQGERKDVLIVYGLQSSMPIVFDWDRGIRSAIDEGLEQPIRIETEYLDLLRTQGSEYRDRWLDLLRRKYQGNDPDLVIVVFDPGLSFLLGHRDQLFPGTPVIFCSAHFYQSSGIRLPPDLTGVTYELGYASTLELARNLRPETRTVAVVAGTSDFAQLMVAEAQSVFAEYPELEFQYLTGLPVEELQVKVAQLPEDAIVLFLVYVRDPQGGQHYANDVLSLVSASAPGPTFSLWDTNLGSGTAGGHMVRVEQQGRLAGEIAVRVMQGESPASIPVTGQDSNRYVVDSREMRRWNMDEGRLPRDSAVLYRETSLWQQYGAYILATASVLVLQAVLIAGLLINRARRRRAEQSLIRSRAEARGLAGRLISAQEEERKRIAREMHDDLSQRVAAMAIDTGNLTARLEDEHSAKTIAGGIQTELVSLAEDMHQMSRQLHPAILDDLGLEDALCSECQAFAEHEAVDVNFDARDVPRTLPKPVSVCVYRVAQEALRNAGRHSAADQISVAVVADDEFLYLTVLDRGQGFEVGRGDTKPGVGLAGMQERARLVGGTLTIDTEPGGGTTISLRVPVVEPES